jgi:hypothetical protein
LRQSDQLFSSEAEASSGFIAERDRLLRKAIVEIFDAGTPSPLKIAASIGLRLPIIADVQAG